MAAELEAFRLKLTRLQALLYAAHKHSLLIVLQAMDAGGKDGTVNHVFAAFNAQGTTVTGFKQPTRVCSSAVSPPLSAVSPPTASLFRFRVRFRVEQWVCSYPWGCYVTELPV